ncbi:MAG TPA: argininosuccinate synthase, partial [Thermosulfidibacter takaii]|nr:argininosuccinate synthase [Thermosulfidibacter takaii]
MEKPKKVVLAYSGGLDTSVIIRWLIDNYGCEVIAFSADVGQQEDMEEVRKKALATGASKVHIYDLKEEFLRDYCFKALKAQALYEGKYPLGTALNRPIISKYLVEVAEKEGADAVAHGATGKGNDQVRFEVSVMALNPDIKCLAPVREWEFKSREEEIEYAQKHGIPVPVTKDKPYSIDLNIWSISIECGILEDPWEEPPEDAYLI